MSSDDQADRQQQYLYDLLADGVKGVGKNALKRHPAFFYRCDNTAKAGFGEDNACCRFCHVRGRRYSNSDLCLTERRCIVGSVTAHPHCMTALLERLDKV